MALRCSLNRSNKTQRSLGLREALPLGRTAVAPQPALPPPEALDGGDGHIPQGGNAQRSRPGAVAGTPARARFDPSPRVCHRLGQREPVCAVSGAGLPSRPTCRDTAPPHHISRLVRLSWRVGESPKSRDSCPSFAPVPGISSGNIPTLSKDTAGASARPESTDQTRLPSAVGS